MSDALRTTCPTFFSTAAIVTTMVFAFWCQSFAFKGNSYTINEGQKDQTEFNIDDLHISPWYMKKTEIDSTELSYSGGEWTFTVNSKDTCVTYGSDLDTKWTFVRVATIITPSLGGVLTLLVCLTPLFAKLMAKAWHLIAMTFILVLTLFQGLTFLMLKSNACNDNPVVRELTNELEEAAQKVNIDLRSLNMNQTDLFWDDDCSWDSGSSVNVVSIVCWFFAGVAMLALGAPTVVEGPSKQAQDAQPEQSAARDPEATAEEGNTGNDE